MMPDFDPAARFAINILVNDASEVLLLKRRPDARLGAGLWGFPAGHVEEGEDPEACAWRELNEEIGRDFRTDLITRLGPIRDSFYGGIYEIHLFHRHWITGSVSLNHEHTEYAWVGRESFRKYPVMNGIDEDLYYLDIWPKEYLNPDKLPDKSNRGYRHISASTDQ